MKKWQKILLGITGIAAVLVIGSGLIVKGKIKAPSEAARQALTAAKTTSDGYYFKGDPDKPLILFAPGATIDVGGYSVWAQELSRHGYGVYLLSMPLELSVLDLNKAQKIIDELQPESFILGGHSMGGAAASHVAAKHLKDPRLKGIFYLSSYAPGGKLAKSQLPALVLSGSKDIDITDQEIRAKKADFPKDAQFVTLEGGDHLGFANTEEGTPQATISAEEQNKLVAAELLTWIGKL